MAVSLSSLGWLLALPIAGSVLLGWYLDRRFGTGPGWTLILLGVGVGAAGVECYLVVRAALRRGRDG